MMRRFIKGDTDQTGMKNFSHLPASRQTHFEDEIETAQRFLGLENDGNCGPATLQAIANWEAANGQDFYAACFDLDPWETETAAEAAGLGEPPPTEATTAPRIKRVPHMSQWDYNHVGIVPARTVVRRDSQGEPLLDNDGNKQYLTLPAKSVRQIGCLSCCCDIISAYHTDTDPNIESFVRNLKAFDGYGLKDPIQWHDDGTIRYDPAGNIKWGAVEKLTGLNHQRDVGVIVGQMNIDEGNPIIVCIRPKKGGTHFIVGIGYDDRGFHCHDVGSWRGDADKYPNRVPGPGDKPGQTFVEYGDVIRVDMLTEDVARI